MRLHHHTVLAFVLAVAVPAFAGAQSGQAGQTTQGQPGQSDSTAGQTDATATPNSGAGTQSQTATQTGSGSTTGTTDTTSGTTDRAGSRPGSTVTTGQTGTTGQATSTGGQDASGTSVTSSSQTTRTSTSNSYNPSNSRWIASGFVGSNFGASTDGSAADFGGSLGYSWRNWVGAEFLAGFTPNFEVQNLALFAGEKPQVNSYMFNAIGSASLGPDGNFQPFISGGFGAVTLRSNLLNNDTGNAVSNVFAPDDTRPGGNIGAGIMAFMGAWGIRGDVRYFRAFNTDEVSTSTSVNGTPAAIVGSSVLPGLDFWRANIGLAVRW